MRQPRHPFCILHSAVCIAALVAACTASAGTPLPPSFAPYTSSDYVQDGLIAQFDGERFAFVQQSHEPFVRLIAPGPDHAGKENLIARVQTAHDGFIERSREFFHNSNPACLAAWQFRFTATGREAM